MTAINHYLSETNITLIERTAGNVSQYPDYVEVIEDSVSCWSPIGRTCCRQQMNISSQCGYGATVHEIAHALGLAHEKSRSDRDSYVTINYSNIPSDKHDNFNKSGSSHANYGSYDYDSIMHYGAYDCLMNGSIKTIITETGARIGQRNGLTTSDVSVLNFLYPNISYDTLGSTQQNTLYYSSGYLTCETGMKERTCGSNGNGAIGKQSTTQSVLI